MKRILVTGATGFVGSRFVEMACERGLEVIALVRNWQHAARISRLSCRMVHGDVLDPSSLQQAMQGCDTVFHCAVDNQAIGETHRRVSVEGTRNVFDAVLTTGVDRVVHLSSAAVFSYSPGPEVATEEAQYNYSGDDYCDGKIESEKVALEYIREKGVRGTVLRPTIVYGPFGDYTKAAVDLIRRKRMVLVDGGSGVCNCLYVDNLVEAMLLSAVTNEAVGQIYHISDDRPVTWREFIEAHARVVDAAQLPLRELSLAEVQAIEQENRVRPVGSLRQMARLLRNPKTRQALKTIPLVNRSVGAVKWVGRQVLPKPLRQNLRQRILGSKTDEAANLALPEPVLSPAEALMFSVFCGVAFDISKARRELGYRPSFDFNQGMDRTAAWIHWARL